MSPHSFVFLRYLNTVFDNIKDSVMLVSIEPDGVLRLLLANKSFHDISGFGKDCVGKDLYEFIGPESHELMKRRLKQVLKLKKPISYTTWIRLPRGERALEVEVIPVLSTVDDVVQIIVLSRDITKLARLKEQVRLLKAAARRHV